MSSQPPVVEETAPPSNEPQMTAADEARMALDKSRDEHANQIEEVFDKMQRDEIEPEDLENLLEVPETEEGDPPPPASEETPPATDEEQPTDSDDLLNRIGIEDEAPPAEETPPEPSTDEELGAALAEIDAIEEPKRLSQKGKEGWAASKEQRKTLVRENYSLKKQLAERETAAPNEQLTSLQAENEQLKNQLSILDYEASDDFKSKFVEPETRAVEALNSLIQTSGEQVDVSAILALPEAQRNQRIDELVEKLPRVSGQRVINLVAGLDDLRDQKSIALSDVQSRIAELRTNAEEGVQKRTQERIQVYDNVQARFMNDSKALFSPFDLNKSPAALREYHEKFNNGLQALNETARHLALAEDNPEVLASIPIKASAFDFQMEHVIPEIGRRLAIANKEITALRKEVASYRKVSPQSHRDSPKPKVPAVDPNTTPQQRIDAMIQETFSG